MANPLPLSALVAVCLALLTAPLPATTVASGPAASRIWPAAAGVVPDRALAARLPRRLPGGAGTSVARATPVVRPSPLPPSPAALMGPRVWTGVVVAVATALPGEARHAARGPAVVVPPAVAPVADAPVAASVERPAPGPHLGAAPALATPAPLVTLPPAPAADGTVALDPETGGWLHRRAADALAMISYPWPDLAYEIVFEPGRRGLRARVLLLERRIEVFVRPSDTVRQTAFDLAHELGHALDFERGTPATRAAWQRARGLDPARPWFGCNACPDLATPAGDFAESFAAWLVGAGGFSSRLGPPPDEAQRALLAALAGPD